MGLAAILATIWGGLTLLWAILVVLPTDIIGTAYTGLGSIWNNRLLLLLLIPGTVGSAVWLKYQDDVFEITDNVFLCGNALAGRIIRQLVDVSAFLYRFFICVWNTFWICVTAPARVFVDQLFRCGKIDDIISATINIFIEFFKMIGNFMINGTFFNGPLRMNRFLNENQRLSEALVDNLCCLCQDSCFVWKWAFSPFVSDAYKCMISNFVNTGVRLVQIPLAMLQGAIKGKLVRPNFSRMASLFTTAGRCLGTAGDDFLQETWDTFIGGSIDLFGNTVPGFNVNVPDIGGFKPFLAVQDFTVPRVFSSVALVGFGVPSYVMAILMEVLVNVDQLFEYWLGQTDGSFLQTGLPWNQFWNLFYAPPGLPVCPVQLVGVNCPAGSVNPGLAETLSLIFCPSFGEPGCLIACPISRFVAGAATVIRTIVMGIMTIGPNFPEYFSQANLFDQPFDVLEAAGDCLYEIGSRIDPCVGTIVQNVYLLPVRVFRIAFYWFLSGFRSFWIAVGVPVSTPVGCQFGSPQMPQVWCSGPGACCLGTNLLTTKNSLTSLFQLIRMAPYATTPQPRGILECFCVLVNRAFHFAIIDVLRLDLLGPSRSQLENFDICCNWYNSCMVVIETIVQGVNFVLNLRNPWIFLIYPSGASIGSITGANTYRWFDFTYIYRAVLNLGTCPCGAFVVLEQMTDLKIASCLCGITTTLGELAGVSLRLGQTFIKRPTHPPDLEILRGPWINSMRSAGCFFSTFGESFLQCSSIRTRMEAFMMSLGRILFMPLDVTYCMILGDNISNFQVWLKHIYYKVSVPFVGDPRIISEGFFQQLGRMADCISPVNTGLGAVLRAIANDYRDNFMDQFFNVFYYFLMLFSGQSGSVANFTQAVFNLLTDLLVNFWDFFLGLLPSQISRPLRGLLRIFNRLVKFINRVTSICNKTPFCRRFTPGLRSVNACYEDLESCQCELFGICADDPRALRENRNRKRSFEHPVNDDVALHHQEEEEDERDANGVEYVDTLEPESPGLRDLARRLSHSLKKQKRSTTSATESMYQYWVEITNGTDDSACGSYVAQYRTVGWGQMSPSERIQYGDCLLKLRQGIVAQEAFQEYPLHDILSATDNSTGALSVSGGGMDLPVAFGYDPGVQLMVMTDAVQVGLSFGQWQAMISGPEDYRAIRCRTGDLELDAARPESLIDCGGNISAATANMSAAQLLSRHIAEKVGDITSEASLVYFMRQIGIVTDAGISLARRMRHDMNKEWTARIAMAIQQGGRRSAFTGWFSSADSDPSDGIRSVRDRMDFSSSHEQNRVREVTLADWSTHTICPLGWDQEECSQGYRKDSGLMRLSKAMLSVFKGDGVPRSFFALPPGAKEEDYHPHIWLQAHPEQQRTMDVMQQQQQENGTTVIDCNDPAMRFSAICDASAHGNWYGFNNSELNESPADLQYGWYSEQDPDGNLGRAYGVLANETWHQIRTAWHRLAAHTVLSMQEMAENARNGSEPPLLDSGLSRLWKTKPGGSSQRAAKNRDRIQQCAMRTRQAYVRTMWLPQAQADLAIETERAVFAANSTRAHYCVRRTLDMEACLLEYDALRMQRDGLQTRCVFAELFPFLDIRCDCAIFERTLETIFEAVFDCLNYYIDLGGGAPLNNPLGSPEDVRAVGALSKGVLSMVHERVIEPHFWRRLPPEMWHAPIGTGFTYVDPVLAEYGFYLNITTQPVPDYATQTQLVQLQELQTQQNQRNVISELFSTAGYGSSFTLWLVFDLPSQILQPFGLSMPETLNKLFNVVRVTATQRTSNTGGGWSPFNFADYVQCRLRANLKCQNGLGILRGSLAVFITAIGIYFLVSYQFPFVFSILTWIGVAAVFLFSIIGAYLDVSGEVVGYGITIVGQLGESVFAISEALGSGGGLLGGINTSGVHFLGYGGGAFGIVWGILGTLGEFVFKAVPYVADVFEWLQKVAVAAVSIVKSWMPRIIGVGLPVLLTIMFWLVVSFGWSPYCFPALPTCIATQFKEQIADVILVERIPWPEGLLLDASQIDAGSCGFPRKFKNCARDGFPDFRSTFAAALSWISPELYRTLRNMYRGSGIEISLLSETLNRFDFNGRLPPSADLWCLLAVGVTNLVPLGALGAVGFLVLRPVYQVASVVFVTAVAVGLFFWPFLSELTELIGNRPGEDFGDDGAAGAELGSQRRTSEDSGAALSTAGGIYPGGPTTTGGLDSPALIQSQLIGTSTLPTVSSVSRPGSDLRRRASSRVDPIRQQRNQREAPITPGGVPLYVFNNTVGWIESLVNAVAERLRRRMQPREHAE